MERRQNDFMVFAIIGDAQVEMVDGVLTMRVDLRPSTD
jgi:hypothetical protein